MGQRDAWVGDTENHSSIPVLVVSADISRCWDWSVFVQTRCFCKCNSVGRLGSGVSCAVRCLSGTAQRFWWQYCPSMSVLGSSPVGSWGGGTFFSEACYRAAVNQQSCLPRTAAHLSNSFRSDWFFWMTKTHHIKEMPPQNEGTEFAASLEPRGVSLAQLAESWLSSQTGHEQGTTQCQAKQKVMKNDTN